jgi:hypothetical protein
MTTATATGEPSDAAPTNASGQSVRVRPLSRIEIAAPAADLTTVLDRRVALPAATGWEIMAEQMLLTIVITGFTKLLELGVPLVDQTRPRASDVTVEMRELHQIR